MTLVASDLHSPHLPRCLAIKKEIKGQKSKASGVNLCDILCPPELLLYTGEAFNEWVWRVKYPGGWRLKWWALDYSSHHV